jgi:hypothetical protein
MLDQPKISSFMDGFFGYGNLESEVWFIGMEEGGGDSLADIARRLEVWHELKKPSVADLFEFHNRLGIVEYFSGTNPKLQATWKMLARYALSYEGVATDSKSIRCFQANRLGRKNSNNCLLELLPLPSPSTNHWLYSEFTDMPELESRSQYRRIMIPRRIEQLREMIDRHKPTVVVFYGKTYEAYWMEISGSSDNWHEINGGYASEFNGVSYEIRPHPAAFGVRKQHFEVDRSN